MVVGSLAGSLDKDPNPASLLTSAAETRAKITAGTVQTRKPPAVEQHQSKVCSVLLPIYAASGAQKDDIYKGYDKVTTSPTHLKTLPKWNVTEERKNKYRNSELALPIPACTQIHAPGRRLTARARSCLDCSV